MLLESHPSSWTAGASRFAAPWLWGSNVISPRPVFVLSQGSWQTGSKDKLKFIFAVRRTRDRNRCSGGLAARRDSSPRCFPTPFKVDFFEGKLKAACFVMFFNHRDLLRGKPSNRTETRSGPLCCLLRLYELTMFSLKCFILTCSSPGLQRPDWFHNSS